MNAMLRWFVFMTIGLVCLGARCLAAESDRSRRPNFVIVVVDDLRWDELGCMGHPWAKTPHIDRVAREGALFRNAFCTTPLCSPARAALLTGRYAHANGIVDNTNRSALSHRLITFPRLLHDAGYRTAFIGKWHMGNDNTARPGFDHWICLKGQGRANDPELNIDGVTSTVKGYVTDIFTEQSIAFINKQRGGRPFCLYLSQKALHRNRQQFDDGSTAAIGSGGFIPAERHKNLYADVKIKKRPNAKDTLEGKPALLRQFPGLPPLSAATGTDRETILGRQRMLKAIDEGLGKILEALERASVLDDTVVVLTSDHGFFYGEHCLAHERRLAYEETIRIPLLVRYPRVVQAGTTIDDVTLAIDLAPTVLDLAGVKVPKNVHGRSLAPRLGGQEMPPRRSFLIEYYSDTVFPRIYKMGYKAVRTDRWKYIRYVELEGMDELYDLKADPYEMKNLVKTPQGRKVAEALGKEIDRLVQKTR